MSHPARGGGAGTLARALLASVAWLVGCGSPDGGDVSAMSAALTPEADTTTVRFAPTADAQVAQARPTTRHGTSRFLRVEGGAGVEKRAYLTFAVSGVQGLVVEARLRLYVSEGSRNGPALHLAASADWREDELSWSRQPGARGGALAHAGAVARGAYVEWDVTEVVTGDGRYGFVLLPDSRDGMTARSREDRAARRPELIVVTRDVAAASAGCVRPSGIDRAVRRQPRVTLPPAGGAYVDPTFGTKIVRVTSGGDAAHAFSYWPAFNADSTRLLISQRGVPTLYALDGLNDRVEPLGPLFAAGLCHWQSSHFSRADPEVLYCLGRRRKQLYAIDLATREVAVLADFESVLDEPTDDEVIHLVADDARLVFAFHTRDHRTGRRLKAVVHELVSGVTHVRRYAAADALDEVVVDRSGTRAVVVLQERWDVWDFRLDAVTRVDRSAAERGGCGHQSPGTGLLVGEDCWRPGLQRRLLADPERPTSVVDLLTASGAPNWTVSSHASILQVDERWLVAAIYAEPRHLATWDPWEQELVAVALDGSWALRLAHHHSNVGDDPSCTYWNQPRPSVSFDGRWVAFTSNFDGASGCDTSRRDVFLLKVPPICP